MELHWHGSCVLLMWVDDLVLMDDVHRLLDDFRTVVFDVVELPNELSRRI